MIIDSLSFQAPRDEHVVVTLTAGSVWSPSSRNAGTNEDRCLALRGGFERVVPERLGCFVPLSHDVLREKHGVVAPGADLLVSNVFDVMMNDVVEAAVIGKGVVDGIECDHLAFRNMETDWQIWIESGAKPIPRKYVITSKGIAEAPQYTLRIKEWKTDVAADAFAFKADPSSKKIALGDLSDMDEVPQGTTTTGGKK